MTTLTEAVSPSLQRPVLGCSKQNFQQLIYKFAKSSGSTHGEGLLYMRSTSQARFFNYTSAGYCELSEEGLPYVRSVRKVYHM